MDQDKETPKDKSSIQSVNSDSPILKANYDDLAIIFEYLNLSDICAIGKTCKQLQYTCGIYFNEKYPAQELVIVKNPENHIIQQIDNSTTNLAPFARRLQVYVDSDDELNYMAKNFHDNVKAIYFHITRHPNLNLAIVKDILQNVEYIAFRKVRSCELSPVNLTFCQNLKYLNLNITNLKFFYNLHCPTLRTLEIDLDFRRSSFELITFLKMNPQIQNLLMKNSGPNFMLFVIEEAKPSLDMLSIYTYDDELVQISGRLNRCHDFGYFQHFSFSGSASSFLKDIARVPSLTGLFISYDGMRISKINDIGRCLSEMENFLYLNISNITTNEADSLSKCLVNIEQVNLFDSSLRLLSIFARRLPKLKVASCSKKTFENDDFDFSLKEINDERTTLPNACKLLIYVGDDDVFRRLRWKFIDLNFDYLEIRSYTQYCHYESENAADRRYRPGGIF